MIYVFVATPINTLRGDYLSGGLRFDPHAVSLYLAWPGLALLPLLLPRLAQDARVSFSVSNPWRWASSHWDPETDLATAGEQGGATIGGYNYATDSAPRTYLLTLRFGF